MEEKEKQKDVCARKTGRAGDWNHGKVMARGATEGYVWIRGSAVVGIC